MKKYKLQNKAIGEYIRENTIDLINKKNNAIELSIASGCITVGGTLILLGALFNTYQTGEYTLDKELNEIITLTKANANLYDDGVLSTAVDPLIGLKENVIIGKLIPAGTGMKRYRDVTLSTDAKIAAAAEAKRALEAALEEDANEEVVEVSEVEEAVEVTEEV